MKENKLAVSAVKSIKCWQKIEDSTQCKTDRVEIDLGEFKELTEQSIMMLGQVFNDIRYNRRLSVLNALMKEPKSKQMLKEKASIFPESHKELFGQNFREDWCTNLKTKQRYQEVLLRRPNRQQQHSARIDRPFEGALLRHHMVMEEVVKGVYHKHSSLEQCHKHRSSIVRVIKSPCLNTPELLDVDRLNRNLFHVKERQAPLAGRLKFYSEN